MLRVAVCEALSLPYCTGPQTPLSQFTGSHQASLYWIRIIWAVFCCITNKKTNTLYEIKLSERTPVQTPEACSTGGKFLEVLPRRFPHSWMDYTTIFVTLKVRVCPVSYFLLSLTLIKLSRVLCVVDLESVSFAGVWHFSVMGHTHHHTSFWPVGMKGWSALSWRGFPQSVVQIHS